MPEESAVSDADLPLSPLDRITPALAAVKATHGNVGLKAIADFMFMMGSTAALVDLDAPEPEYHPCDFVMQEAWAMEHGATAVDARPKPVPTGPSPRAGWDVER